MLEQKLIVGRYLDFPQAILGQPGMLPTQTPGDMVTCQPNQFHIQESTGVFTKTSVIVAGAGPAHRTFTWLPYTPGLITVVALVGADVLTGPMSGCWLATYRKPNGVPHAAHVGTDVASVARTAAVNTAWNLHATAHAGDIIGGFNPLRHWNGANPAGKAGETAGKMYALYTTNNHYYVVFLWQQGNPTNRFRIAGLQLINSVTVARLQHVDQPGP